jgi:hypothetical protein
MDALKARLQSRMLLAQAIRTNTDRGGYFRRGTLAEQASPNHATAGTSGGDGFPTPFEFFHHLRKSSIFEKN